MSAQRQPRDRTPYANRRWIACLLEFKGRRRTVMSPRRYTELFFLDEAVALSAGHRPCGECRRERFNAFLKAWRLSAASVAHDPLLAPEIDEELHRTRIDAQRGKVTHFAPLNSLPDGCFITLGDSSCLVWEQGLPLWSPDGYLKRISAQGSLVVSVLTQNRSSSVFAKGTNPKYTVPPVLSECHRGQAAFFICAGECRTEKTVYAISEYQGAPRAPAEWPHSSRRCSGMPALSVSSCGRAGECSPEKAGVGGSSPSLATIFSITYRHPKSATGHNWSQFGPHGCVSQQ
jgi:hypothetical protein